ncbi:MAG TPA: PEP-CTERM sorting domain-containing protein [Phycisphaerae bacterium]|nr:PEP-CTERM sorting domain-containing protein [Phycisphaerae bacterium]
MKAAIASIVVVVASLAGAPAALAIHVFDPPWVQNPTDPQWAGGSTTSQGWEFGNGHAYVNNPFGAPTVEFPGGSPQLVTDFPQQPGVPTMTWHIDQEGGGMLLSIPNDPIPRPVKYIHLQYTADKAGGIPGTTPAGAAAAGGVAGHGGAWYTYEWNLEIRPNPPFETIWIPFPVSSNIEEVHVATICVPEPATLGLLLCGGAAAMFGRRPR